MTPQQDVDLVTKEELESGVRRVLDRLNLSRDDLREQAATGRFSSERARLTWLAIRNLDAAAS